METLDGYELKEGDICFISCQDPTRIHNVSPNPRRAVYLDEQAQRNGWDFSTKLRYEGEIEVIAVWKNRPQKLREA